MSDNKAQQVQQQVDEVVGIMQDNIQKVMDRGERLDTFKLKLVYIYVYK